MTSKLKKRKRANKVQRVERITHPDAAGIDVGAYEIYVAVPEDRDKESVRSFSTFTEDLHRMARWLIDCGIDTVAMESTGVYWIPIFQILESYGIEVCLVNARHVKNVPGRKTDVQDCQWLQYLHSVGLLRGSFRPGADVVAVRTLFRHRDNLVKNLGVHIQLMQKALTQMNLFLHNVIRDITGKTGMAIIDAILEGEHDPKVLAGYRDYRIKADEETIAKSLEGDYKVEHLFTLKQAVDLYRYHQQLIQECDEQIERLLETFKPKKEKKVLADTPKPSKKRNSNDLHFDAQSHLLRIYGVDLTSVPGISGLTAHTIFTEIGTDFHKFKSVRHFASWLGLAPNNQISGGQVLSSKTAFSSNRVAQALRLAAYGIANSKSYLGHFYRKMRARLGGPKAITAVAHKLARIIYTMVTKQIPYDESVFQVEELKYQQKRLKKLEKQASDLGLKLVPVSMTTHGQST